MKKKILIIGITGQDGSLLAEHLINKKDIIIYGLIRKSSNRNYSNLKNFLNHKNFKIVHGDLLDVFSIEKIIKELNRKKSTILQIRIMFDGLSNLTYSFDVTASSVLKILKLLKIIKKLSIFTHLRLICLEIYLNKLNENEKFAP